MAGSRLLLRNLILPLSLYAAVLLLTFSGLDAAKTGDERTVLVLNVVGVINPATAEYIATKLYRFFVRDDVSPALTAELGAVLRDNDYELRPLLTAIFLSRDFSST